MGGWLAPYATIGPNGQLIYAKDREGHMFEAARTLGQIDFADYITTGRWNDTHLKPKVWVGVPRLLEHHDQTSELAKAHKVVGWWTEGHLFDRRDPRSWSMFTDYEPTSQDLDRADYFWNMATMLKGLPRSLAFSAEGLMLLSPCQTRIIYAKVQNSAVCETPQIPQAAAFPLELTKGREREPLDIVLSPQMARAKPCDDCRCPAGARCVVRPLELALTAENTQALQREDLEGSVHDSEREGDDDDSDSDEAQRLIDTVQRWSRCTPAQARRWVRRFMQKLKREAGK